MTRRGNWVVAHYRIVVLSLLAGLIGSRYALLAGTPPCVGIETSPAEDARNDAEKPPRVKKRAPKRADTRLWPELTAEQQDEAIRLQREFLEQLPAKLAHPGLWSIETEFFLFATDLPAQIVAPIPGNLDRMYRALCEAFGVDENKNVWHGKAVVIAFAKPGRFFQFETMYSPFPVPPGTQGRAHLQSGGEVLISCHSADRPSSLPRLVVHEMSHGFMYRYKSQVVVPNWLDEGVAEWISALAVPGDRTVARRQNRALERLRKTRSLEGFFMAPQISDWQYGIAASITDFLLRWNRPAFRELIDGIKLGVGWEESLKASYGVTPEELALRYGLEFGIPGVRP